MNKYCVTFWAVHDPIYVEAESVTKAINKAQDLAREKWVEDARQLCQDATGRNKQGALLRLAEAENSTPIFTAIFGLI